MLSSIALHVLDPDLSIGQIGGGFRNVPPNEEFITMYPRKSIVELHDTAEVGLVITPFFYIICLTLICSIVDIVFIKFCLCGRVCL